MEERQSIQAKKGEIIFRSKLFERQVEGKDVFKDYFAKVEIIEHLKSKINKSQIQFNEMRNNGIALSPFLEIGSERCERSMLLADKFGAAGFATDISYQSLRSAEYYSKIFKMELPYRVCCDVYNLPFRKNSFSFIFCYATLHHFPDPTPIIREVVRVLNTGFFFFDEEPVKQFLKLPIAIRTVRTKNFMTRAIEHFLKGAHKGMNFGIIENRDISIRDWRLILSSFDKRNISVYIPGFRSGFRSTNPASVYDRILTCKLDSHGVSIKRAIISLIGGTISGLCSCQKNGNHATKNIFDLLACPNCLEVDQTICDVERCKLDCTIVCVGEAIKIESGKAKIVRQSCNLCFNCLFTCPLNAVKKPKLLKGRKAFICQNCGKSFPIIEDILMLLSEEGERQLYPEASKVLR